MLIDKIALFLAIVGGLNWGSVGLFKVDLVAYLCGGAPLPWPGSSTWWSAWRLCGA